MKKARECLPFMVFALILVGHAAYSTLQNDECAPGSVEMHPMDGGVAAHLRPYISHQDYMMGLSYALAGGFTVYALLTFIRSRRKGATGIVGGSVLTAVIYGAGCFLTGCCGSPMLTVYLGVWGASVLGFAKPLILLVTVVSVAVGFFWMRRRAACCAKPECVE